MKAIALAVLFAAGAASAQEHQLKEFGANHAPFASVFVFNYESDLRLRNFSVMTSEGEVNLQYRATWNQLADPRDEVEVISLPDGVIAIPNLLLIDENQTGRIDLYIFTGM